MKEIEQGCIDWMERPKLTVYNGCQKHMKSIIHDIHDPDVYMKN